MKCLTFTKNLMMYKKKGGINFGHLDYVISFHSFHINYFKKNHQH